MANFQRLIASFILFLASSAFADGTVPVHSAWTIGFGIGQLVTGASVGEVCANFGSAATANTGGAIAHVITSTSQDTLTTGRCFYDQVYYGSILQSAAISTQRTLSCPANSVLQGETCTCAAGYNALDDQCRPKNPCPAGQHEEGGVCVPNDCQADEIRVDGQCVKKPECEPGDTDDGSCTPPANPPPPESPPPTEPPPPVPPMPPEPPSPPTPPDNGPNRPSGPNNPDNCSKSGTSVGAPIMPAIAAKVRTETDWATNKPTGLHFTRYYLSSWGLTTSSHFSTMGKAWRHNHDIELSQHATATGTTVRILAGDGHVRSFARTAGSSTWTPRAHNDQLTLDSSGKWTYRRADTDTTLVFDATGKLLSTTARNGWKTDYAYDTAGRLTTVTDWLGQVLAFSYSSSGQLVSVAAPDGQVIALGYDDGRLKQVTYPDTRCRLVGLGAHVSNHRYQSRLGHRPAERHSQLCLRHTLRQTGRAGRKQPRPTGSARCSKPRAEHAGFDRVRNRF
ncbi:RHS repeat protein [Acidovorax sp. Leaf78]|uniref:RHS repeat domain-containing protein n=1 Tax=Acidovorax sp. Leaf78 TaxID=1736237 RepID=UPI000B2FBF7E